MKTLLRAGLSVGLTAALIGAPSSANSGPAATTAEVRLAATVLTLEGGLVGLQHVVAFTQMQLGGQLCDAPNNCQAVDYFALPLGQRFNEMGADRLIQDIAALPNDGTPITMFGHSQGGQVIYAALRRWAADPANALTRRGCRGSRSATRRTTSAARPPPLPADSPYQGTEVIKRYDGWADWPTDTTNLLAVANAAVVCPPRTCSATSTSTSTTPTTSGTPRQGRRQPREHHLRLRSHQGAALVSLTGPWCRCSTRSWTRSCDRASRRHTSGRSGRSPTDGGGEPRTGRRAGAAGRPASVDLVGAAPTEVQVLDNGDTDQNDEQHQSHDRGPAYRRSAESFARRSGGRPGRCDRRGRHR